MVPNWFTTYFEARVTLDCGSNRALFSLWRSLIKRNAESAAAHKHIESDTLTDRETAEPFCLHPKPRLGPVKAGQVLELLRSLGQQAIGETEHRRKHELLNRFFQLLMSPVCGFLA